MCSANKGVAFEIGLTVRLIRGQIERVKGYRMT